MLLLSSRLDNRTLNVRDVAHPFDHLEHVRLYHRGARQAQRHVPLGIYKDKVRSIVVPLTILLVTHKMWYGNAGRFDRNRRLASSMYVTPPK
jgi:hypothetical protein